MLNISPLFYSADDRPNFHSVLELPAQEKLDLTSAKNQIRKALRTGIPAALKAAGHAGEIPEPRFFTQGSWAYKTLNSPAHLPPQQADVDDGVYLPISFVKETNRPSIASAAFFSAAEAALRVLVEINRDYGWKLITDKPTCIRIQVSSQAHIDIPLYSIPDDEYVTLQKASMEHGYDSINEAVGIRSTDSWTKLETEKVLLAHRTENWIQSDPRPIKDWFVDEVELKGEQLRRIVRYLKAFRDWNWKSGGPSSVLLMAAATPLFQKIDRRDDLALWEVTKLLPNTLRNGVTNPVNPKELLTARLRQDQIEEAAQKISQLGALLSTSITGTCTSSACTNMRAAFGPRFPNEPGRIQPSSVAAAIAAVPAQAAASEPIGRTKAG